MITYERGETPNNHGNHNFYYMHVCYVDSYIRWDNFENQVGFFEKGDEILGFN